MLPRVTIAKHLPSTTRSFSSAGRRTSASSKSRISSRQRLIRKRRSRRPRRSTRRTRKADIGDIGHAMGRYEEHLYLGSRLTVGGPLCRWKLRSGSREGTRASRSCMFSISPTPRRCEVGLMASSASRRRHAGVGGGSGSDDAEAGDLHDDLFLRASCCTMRRSHVS